MNFGTWFDQKRALIEEKGWQDQQLEKLRGENAARVQGIQNLGASDVENIRGGYGLDQEKIKGDYGIQDRNIWADANKYGVDVDARTKMGIASMENQRARDLAGWGEKARTMLGMSGGTGGAVNGKPDPFEAERQKFLFGLAKERILKGDEALNNPMAPVSPDREKKIRDFQQRIMDSLSPQQQKGPTWEEFYRQAKQRNQNVPDSVLRKYYDDNYGRR